VEKSERDHNAVERKKEHFRRGDMKADDVPNTGILSKLVRDAIHFVTFLQIETRLKGRLPIIFLSNSAKTTVMGGRAMRFIDLIFSTRI
jgi:hypothetical protein